MAQPTIQQSTDAYLAEIAGSKSANTVRSYGMILRQFLTSLAEQGLDPTALSAGMVSEQWAMSYFRSRSELSHQSYMVAVYALAGWYAYLARNGLAVVNAQKVKELAKSYHGNRSIMPIEAPDLHDLAQVVDYAWNLGSAGAESRLQELRNLRDRALIILLADTVVDVDSISRLRRSNLDLKRCKLVVPKSSTTLAMDLPARTCRAIVEYLEGRSEAQNIPLRKDSTAPVFVAHNSEKIAAAPLSRKAIGRIIDRRAREALGSKYDGSILPKSFRLYSMRALIDVLPTLHPKIVDRCQSLYVEGQYDEAILNAMKVIEESVRARIGAAPTELGAPLMSKAFLQQPPLIVISTIPSEQEGAGFLFRGAISSLKNPHSHRFVGISDPARAFECLAFASLLMRTLDESQ